MGGAYAVDCLCLQLYMAGCIWQAAAATADIQQKSC
jgi:hypothetical protein